MRSLMRVLTMAAVGATASCGGYSAPTNPTDGGQMSNPPPAGAALVNIQDFSFSPAAVTITAGTAVRWINKGPSVHTSTADGGAWTSPSLRAPQAGDGYGGGTSGGVFDFTFTQPGTYTYHCSLHPSSSYPGHSGTITVNP